MTLAQLLLRQGDGHGETTFRQPGPSPRERRLVTGHQPDEVEQQPRSVAAAADAGDVVERQRPPTSGAVSISARSSSVTSKTPVGHDADTQRRSVGHGDVEENDAGRGVRLLPGKPSLVRRSITG